MPLANLPSGLKTATFELPDGTRVGVVINWTAIQQQARRAAANKNRRSTSGPITVVMPRLIEGANHANT